VPQETQFFRTLFEDAPLPFQVLDHEARFINVNRAWQEEMGYERHEVLGRSFCDFIVSDERSLFEERFAEFAERGNVRGIVWTMVRKDGTTLKVSFYGNTIRDENGNLKRTQCIFFDLGKRTAAEQNLRESEELRMAFMEAAEEGFVLFDPELRLLYVNESGARMFDRSREELLGRLLEEIAPNAAKSERYERYKNVLKTGESYVIERYASQENTKGNWFTIHAFKVGENLGIILRDVSAAKRTEAELVASEARWRALAEGSPDHIFLLDLDLRIEYANSPLAGRRVEQLIGEHLCALALEKDRERIRSILESVRANGHAEDYETESIASDGSMAIHESRVVPRLVGGRIEGLVVSVRDITGRKQSERQIEQLLRTQTAIAELAIGFGSAGNLLDIYRMVYQRVRELMDAEAFVVSRLGVVEGMIHADYVVFQEEEQDPSTLPPIPLEEPGMGMQSEVYRTGERMIVGDYHTVPPNTKTRYRVARPGAAIQKLDRGDVSDLPQSAVLVPMKVRGQVVGVMQVQSNDPSAFTESEAEILAGLANVTAVAMENRNLVRESQETYEGVIRALAKAIDLRDPYTSLHQYGVARVAVEICRKLSLPTDQVRAVELAANIHDIGKIMIPAEILSKPSALSAAQRMIVEAHVVAAHEVLQGISFPWPIDEIVLQHHERIDGSGYPRGLSGDAIRTEARILAVADVVDAMTSHRPYRPAFSTAATAEEVRSMAGVSLDRSVAEACIELLEQRPELFEENGS